jgi:hypothetical protein
MIIYSLKSRRQQFGTRNTLSIMYTDFAGIRKNVGLKVDLIFFSGFNFT